ncbi:hypothetical protein JNB71_03670 [Rhizobium herbae]|uniref:Uncharacterized protein n=1 Tax=Rhizobium herbae TaxID=508661 RepID=A0ABS7H5M1_9HYPH|nr:hypothetical protein [Rhizobium herbae]MBW9062410.1 hypothetical protein [Rhizobium herbae]
MHAEMLESAATALVWQALCTDEGEPFAAFVRGHLNPFTLAGDAEDAIVKAFDEIGLADDAREIIDAAGGAVISQFWLRPADGDGFGGVEFYLIANPDQRRAFPVTGVRFM